MCCSHLSTDSRGISSGKDLFFYEFQYFPLFLRYFSVIHLVSLIPPDNLLAGTAVIYRKKRGFRHVILPVFLSAFLPKDSTTLPWKNQTYFQNIFSIFYGRDAEKRIVKNTRKSSYMIGLRSITTIHWNSIFYEKRRFVHYA